jgi:hypothetical protein
MSNRKFLLGQTVATPAALEALTDARQEPSEFFHRHAVGDWGDCDPEDAAANDAAVVDGDRIFSVYHTKRGVKLWVITEADRSSTCLLLPEDY